MPVVVLACGDKIAQAKALLRLAGKAAGIYPSDPIAAAKVDEIVDYCEDIGSAINPIGRGLPSEEKNAARKQAVSEGGKIYAMLAKLDASIAERGAAGHAVGDALTTADLDVFTKTTGYVSFVCVCVWSVCGVCVCVCVCWSTPPTHSSLTRSLSIKHAHTHTHTHTHAHTRIRHRLVSGFWDGVPSDALAPFRNINTVRKAVASLPAVAAWYEIESHGEGYGAVFKATKDIVL